MSSYWFGLVEMLLVFGVVFGWGFHQLYQLKKLKRADEERERAEQAENDGQ